MKREKPPWVTASEGHCFNGHCGFHLEAFTVVVCMQNAVHDGLHTDHCFPVGSPLGIPTNAISMMFQLLIAEAVTAPGLFQGD